MSGNPNHLGVPLPRITVASSGSSEDHEHSLRIPDASDIEAYDLHPSPVESYYSTSARSPGSDSTVADDESLSLPARVQAALRKSDPDSRPQHPERWYVPLDAVLRIIQPDAVRQYLLDNNISSPGITTQNIVDYVCGVQGSVAERIGARMLFCILLLFGKPQYTRYIFDFYREPQGALSDRDLPLRGQTNRQFYTLVRANGSSLSCFAPGGFWETPQLRTFDEYQWWLLVPVLDSEQHRSLSDRAVLPWKNRGTTIFGNQSEVRKIKINESHHTFDSVRLSC